MASSDDFLQGLIFYNAVGRQNAPPVCVRINHRTLANNAAGIEHGITAHVCPVANERTELAQARVEWFTSNFDEDIAAGNFEI